MSGTMAFKGTGFSWEAAEELWGVVWLERGLGSAGPFETDPEGLTSGAEVCAATGIATPRRRRRTKLRARAAEELTREITRSASWSRGLRRCKPRGLAGHSRPRASPARGLQVTRRLGL